MNQLSRLLHKASSDDSSLIFILLLMLLLVAAVIISRAAANSPRDVSSIGNSDSPIVCIPIRHKRVLYSSRFVF
jgi:hypothetical protein